MIWTTPAISLLSSSLVILLFSVLLVLFERKFIALAQKRLGTTFLGRNGWAHLPADLVKFWLKQTGKHHSNWTSSPSAALGPLSLYFAWSMVGAIFLTSNGMQSTVDFWDYQWLAYFGYANLTTLFMFHIAIGQKSKYASIAAGRLLIVTIMLEVFFSFCFFVLYWHQGGYSFNETSATANITPLWLALPTLASMFFLYVLFEAKRAPFDHSEAESELVAGHQVELGGRALLFLFLCEYVHLYFCLFLVMLLCLGGGDVGALMMSCTAVFDLLPVM